MENIPIHDFSVDDDSSVPFELIKLTKEGSYDTSVAHRHNYYEVFIFENGGGNHAIDFNTFPIISNSIHFVSPGQVHNVVRNENSKGYVLLFSRAYYSNNHKSLSEFPFLNNNSASPILNLREEQFNPLFDLIETIRKEQKTEELLSMELIQSFLKLFLIYCKRYSPKSWKEQFSTESLTFRFRQQIETNYLKLHHVTDYASILNVSEKQLYSTTKNDLGLSPKELIYERIILEAKRLVLYTSYSFEEIAYFLSYHDASHFAKFFKSQTAISPGDFRKKGKEYQ